MLARTPFFGRDSTPVAAFYFTSKPNFLMLSEMNKKSAATKEENLSAILSAALYLELRKGHLQWTMAELSRTAGVGRPLIYYYFGKSKDKVFSEALASFTDFFFDTTAMNSKRLSIGNILEMTMLARAKIATHPHLIALYSMYRTQKGPWTDTLIEAETRYQKMIRNALPARMKPMTSLIWAMLFGLAVTPSLTESDVKNANRFFAKILKAK